MKQKPRILTNYLYGHYYIQEGVRSLEIQICFAEDSILSFFAQSLTQSIGLCVYAKSSNTRLAASSDAFCAYAVWFFFDAMVCLQGDFASLTQVAARTVGH